MATQNSTPTQEQVKSLFDYKDGNLHWKIARAKNKIKANSIAGSKNKIYNSISIFGKTWSLHRVIWIFHFGHTNKEIDHVDGNTKNNNIENLREVTRNQNQYNHKINKRNTSGYKGISFDKKRNKWTVRFNVKKTPIYFGRFDDLELAELVAIEARNKYHKEFARHY